MIPIGNYLYIKVMKDVAFGLIICVRKMVLPAVYDHIEALKINVTEIASPH